MQRGKKIKICSLTLLELILFPIFCHLKPCIIICGQTTQGYTLSCPEIVDEDKLSADAALDLPAFSHKLCESLFLGES